MASGNSTRTVRSTTLWTNGHSETVTSSANAECNDGSAATWLTSAWASENHAPAPRRPSSSQPRVAIRDTGSEISPKYAAYHGGAAGSRMYVINPAYESRSTRRM